MLKNGIILSFFSWFVFSCSVSTLESPLVNQRTLLKELSAKEKTSLSEMTQTELSETQYCRSTSIVHGGVARKNGEVTAQLACSRAQKACNARKNPYSNYILGDLTACEASVKVWLDCVKSAKEKWLELQQSLTSFSCEKLPANENSQLLAKEASVYPNTASCRHFLRMCPKSAQFDSMGLDLSQPLSSLTNEEKEVLLAVGKEQFNQKDTCSWVSTTLSTLSSAGTIDWKKIMPQNPQNPTPQVPQEPLGSNFDSQKCKEESQKCDTYPTPFESTMKKDLNQCKAPIQDWVQCMNETKAVLEEIPTTLAQGCKDFIPNLFKNVEKKAESCQRLYIQCPELK